VRVVLNNDIPVISWKKFFAGNPFATPFQSYDFYCLVNSLDKLSAEAIAVWDDNRILALVVITFQKEDGIAAYFSRRAVIYGGPLADSGFPEAMDMLVKHITLTIRPKAIYSETRNLSDFSCFKEIFASHKWEYVSYTNFILDTSDYEAMVRSVSSSRLRQINKAKNDGVKWKVSESLEEVKEFYMILSELYRRKIRKPLLPWEFFKLFFERKSGVFLSVIYKGKLIGGIMCPILDRKTIYEFYICGLDTEYKAQYPSIMATWAAMEYAAENKILKFDFMGAGKPDEDYGVRDFKARFGGELVEYGRFRKIYNPTLYRIGNFGLNFKRFLRK
jgi:serine/alanine adding enzyme